MGHSMGDIPERLSGTPEERTKRSSVGIPAPKTELILLGCVLITDLQWLFEDNDMAWVVWLSLNWVRLSILCLLVAASTKSYRLKWYSLAAAGWFSSFIPLEIFCPNTTLDPWLHYSSLALYVGIVTYLIRRYDPKKD